VPSPYSGPLEQAVTTTSERLEAAVRALVR
jgi:hypothetical protein